MNNKLKLFTPIVASLMSLSAVLTGLAFFFDRVQFYISAALVFLVFSAVLVMLKLLDKRAGRLMEEIADSVRTSMSGSFSELPTPVMTVYGGRDIVWYNDLCAERVFSGRDMHGADATEILPGIELTNASPAEGYDVEYRGKRYTVFVAISHDGDADTATVYLIDDTRLKLLATEYHESKPTIVLLMVDNYEELMQDYKDSERAQLIGEVEQIVEEYIAANYGFITRVSREKFLAVIEARGTRSILASRFSLLDRVREIQLGGRMSPTLSIGMAGDEDNNLYDAEASARQALDMCLGRGGDQAAVKTANGYEFYGGTSQAVEKRTRVKTRIIANALSQLVDASSNVLIMGHRFADLDSLGSAIGMLKAVKCLNKPVSIAISRSRNLVGPLLEKLLNSGYSPDDFIEPETALEMTGPQTLLIITDTHAPQVVESEQLYRAASSVVVIDHHRRLVNHIDNAVIFYHEPYASSTSEMVTEILQYMPKRPILTRVEAEALLAGIMLDTKNFVIRTGVRTFEAAAWLRRLGADTVEVRKLFASSMNAYQQKTSLVSTAELYRNCAIAASEQQFMDVKIIAPQAADELMSISEVDASFVIFVSDGSVQVSARSLGAINVQLIMEALGGGGHLTMAAAQFYGEDDTVESIHRRVKQAIDFYFDTNAPVRNSSNEKGMVSQ